jgi:hypothetical protein
MRIRTALAIAVPLVAVPLAVQAANGGSSGVAERQASRFTNTVTAVNGSTTFRPVSALNVTLCTVDEVSAVVSVELASNTTAALFVRVKGGTQVFDPGTYRALLTGGNDGTTFTAVFTRTFTNGSRLFTVEVGPEKSQTVTYTINKASVNYVFDKGSC